LTVFEQPKLALLPEVQRGGPRLLGKKPGTGRKAAGNRGQGHFQDRARQLTSPAFGRAILQGLAWARYLRSPSRQSRCVVRRSGRLARLKRGRAARWQARRLPHYAAQT